MNQNMPQDPSRVLCDPDNSHNVHDPKSDSEYFNQQPNAGAEWLNASLDLYLPELEAQGTLVVVVIWWNSSDNTPNTIDNTYMTLSGLVHGAIQDFSLDRIVETMSTLRTVTCSTWSITLVPSPPSTPTRRNSTLLDR